MDRKAVCLLTDFGLEDPYVGQMKGVLLQRAPGARILDLSHAVRRHNVLQAGFFLVASWPFLPSGSVCLAVVDPGVGGSRDILLLQKAGRFVLAPDNGLLTQVLEAPEANGLWRLRHPPDSGRISSTFHGRDLFAPTAAELLLGTAPEMLGTKASAQDIVRLEQAHPVIGPQELEASVVHVDRFGNCLLSLPVSLWDRGLGSLERLRLLEPVQRKVLPALSYASLEPGSLGLLPGSQGVLELALNQGSCSAMLGLDIGATCRFQGAFGALGSSA